MKQDIHESKLQFIPAGSTLDSSHPPITTESRKICLPNIYRSAEGNAPKPDITIAPSTFVLPDASSVVKMCECLGAGALTPSVDSSTTQIQSKDRETPTAKIPQAKHLHQTIRWRRENLVSADNPPYCNDARSAQHIEPTEESISSYGRIAAIS